MTLDCLPTTIRPGLFGLRRRELVVDGAELQDFQFALAVGADYDYFVADFLIQQGAADGRGGGNFSGGYVGLFAGHQLVFHFFVLGVVENLDRRAEADAVAGDVVDVDHAQVGEALADLADAGFDELLALLGHVVLGVFAEVAEGGGFLDFFGEFVDQFVFERVNFVLQFALDLVGHAHGFKACRKGLPGNWSNYNSGGGPGRS